MNTDQLQYLIEISKSPSLSAASEKLHLSTPALSTAIKKLEKELGYTLLNRSFKGISLTENGQWLVEEASAFLEKLEVRRRQMNPETLTRQGDLLVPINYSGSSIMVLAQFICELYQQAPDLNVILQETDKDAIEQQLLDNGGFGFIFRTKLRSSYVDELDPVLQFDPLLSGKLVLMTSSSSDLARFNSITLKKASQYPLCTYQPQLTPQTRAYDFINGTLHLSAKYEDISNYSLYREKVSRGLMNVLGIQLSTDITPTNYVDGCKVLQIRDDITVYFGVLRRKGEELSPNASYFLQEFKKYIAQSLSAQNA